MNELQALVLARCAGFAFRAPGFSHPDVPPALRAGFAFVLSLALTSRARRAQLAPHDALGVALAVEFALGSAIGLAASMLYDGAYCGGRALDDYTGIRASVPAATVAGGAGFGRLWSLAFATAFFTLGGSAVALDGFASTFDVLPPGALVAAANLETFAIALPSTLLRAALFTAGPALACAFTVQIALAATARVVPRLSTFALTFPLVFGTVLVVTLAALAAVLPAAARPWWNLSALRP